MVPFSIEPLNYTQPSGCISNQGQIGNIKLDIDTIIFNDLIILKLYYMQLIIISYKLLMVNPNIQYH